MNEDELAQILDSHHNEIKRINKELKERWNDNVVLETIIRRLLFIAIKDAKNPRKLLLEYQTECATVLNMLNSKEVDSEIASGIFLFVKSDLIDAGLFDKSTDN
jgi:hypothetical protein